MQGIGGEVAAGMGVGIEEEIERRQRRNVRNLARLFQNVPAFRCAAVLPREGTRGLP